MKLTLRACRVIAKASVKELAAAIGVTEDTVYKWESGKCTPKVTHAQKVVEFFNSKDNNLNISLNDVDFLP